MVSRWSEVKLDIASPAEIKELPVSGGIGSAATAQSARFLAGTGETRPLNYAFCLREYMPVSATLRKVIAEPPMTAGKARLGLGVVFSLSTALFPIM